jgi:hypothetical protein
MYSRVDNQQERRVRTGVDYDEEVHSCQRISAQDKLFEAMVGMADKIER